MAHCVTEETNVALAQIDVTDAEDALEVEQTILDLASNDLTLCEAEHEQ